MILKIKELLRDKGLKNKDLAEPLGVSEQQVGKYLRGENKLAAEDVEKIAEFLNVEVSVLYEKTTQGLFSKTYEFAKKFRQAGEDGLDSMAEYYKKKYLDTLEEIEALNRQIQELKKKQ